MEDTIARLPGGGIVEGGAGAAFGPVVDAFMANFRERGEVGAALTVYLRGERVVDLWGGVADPRTGRAWTSTTPALVFSCTKGVLAIGAYVSPRTADWDSTTRSCATGRSSARRARVGSPSGGC